MSMNPALPFFSVVIPVYKNRNCVDDLLKYLQEDLAVLDKSYEVLMVDDCCPENSWERIEAACRKDQRIKGIQLSRNFGQHAAITAGLSRAKGEWIVVMDADLQDHSREISRFVAKSREGYDVVLAQRKDKQMSAVKKMYSWIFYKVLGYFTGTKQDSSIGNFGLYNKKVVAAILELGDYIRFFPSMVRWVGFKLAVVEVAHEPRKAGKSSYTLSKLLRLGVNVILSFSDKPLLLTIGFGIVISCMGFLIALFNLYKYYTGQIKVLGFISIVVSIWILAGIIISIIGMVGLYVGKIFDQTKNRPVFIVNQSLNDEG